MSTIQDAEAMREFIAEALWSEAEESGTDLTTHTYAEGGVLTTDEGLVIRLADGTEFQVTVVRSR
jgi:hypothetical protein